MEPKIDEEVCREKVTLRRYFTLNEEGVTQLRTASGKIMEDNIKWLPIQGLNYFGVNLSKKRVGDLNAYATYYFCGALAGKVVGYKHV